MQINCPKKYSRAFGARLTVFNITVCMHLLITGIKKWQSYLLYYPTAGMVLSVQTASTSLF